MTIEELMTTNGHISLLIATIRGDRKNETVRVSEYRVGARADLFPSERGVCPEWLHIIQKPIHVRDDGAASYQFGQVMKNVPKMLRDLTVTGWRTIKEFGTRIDGDELYVDLRSDEVARLMAKQKAREEQEADTGDQMQMEEVQ